MADFAGAEVETGGGAATAVTWATVAQADAYWANRGNPAAWTGYSEAEKKAGLIGAADYLSMTQLFDWRGQPHPAARLPWPRVGASERNGYEIAEGVIPWRVIEAQCLLAPRAAAALKAGTTLLPPAERGGKIQSESGAGFSTTYAPDAPTYTVQQDVRALVAVLLRDDVDVGQTEPLYLAVDASAPADDPAMQMESYRNPAAP